MPKLHLTKQQLNQVIILTDCIEKINTLIDFYKIDKAGPAYLHVEYVSEMISNIQLDRHIMIRALEEQKQIYENIMHELGLEVGGN